MKGNKKDTLTQSQATSFLSSEGFLQQKTTLNDNVNTARVTNDTARKESDREHCNK